jgi:hypothetical protein
MAVDSVMLNFLEKKSEFHRNIEELEDHFLPELIEKAERKRQVNMDEVNEKLNELEEGVINTMDKLKKLAGKIDETKRVYLTGEQLRKTTLHKTLKKGFKTGKYSLKDYVKHPAFSVDNDSSSSSSRGGGKRKKTRKYRK